MILIFFHFPFFPPTLLSNGLRSRYWPHAPAHHLPSRSLLEGLGLLLTQSLYLLSASALFDLSLSLSYVSFAALSYMRRVSIISIASSRRLSLPQRQRNRMLTHATRLTGLRQTNTPDGSSDSSLFYRLPRRYTRAHTTIKPFLLIIPTQIVYFMLTQTQSI